MVRTFLFGITVAVTLSSVALAASPDVGEVAPELGSCNWVMNSPGDVSLEALRGEVVFIERWGVKCPPCRALIPHIEELQTEHGSKGLHIFTFESQRHSAEETVACVKQNGGKSYAVATSGASDYRTDGGIPHAWLIGVDGRVVWQGNPGSGSLDSLIEEELAKVGLPPLGRDDFDKDVRKAAGYYAKKQIGEAREEAQEVLDDEDSSAEAKADAEFILDHISTLIETRQARAEALLADRNYVQAMEVYQWFQQTMKKEPEGKAAKAKLKELKSDKAIKEEIKAAEALAGLLSKLEDAPPAIQRKTLAAFAEKYEGTKAAEEALARQP